jgi:hypothetical protein
MAENIIDQLKAYQAAQDATRRTADEIERERDLLKEVSSLAKAIKVEFNDVTKNIGKSIEKLELGYELEEKLKQSAFDRSSLQNSLVSLMQQTVAQDKVVSELARINSLTQRQRNAEARLEKANLDAKLASGEIEADQHQKLSNILQQRYLRTSQTYSKELLSANRLSQQLVNTKDLLNVEDKRLAKLAVQSKFLNVGKNVLKDMGPLGSAVSGAFNASKMNPWVLAADAAVAILEKGYENFKAFDKASVDVRKNLGALPGQATVLERNLKVVTIDMMHLGATFDDVAKSINEIANEFTGLVAQDKDLLKTTTALSKQFGIAEGTSVKFLKTLGGISGNSASSQKSMIGFAQKMAQASGVPLGKIMEDVATASDDVRIYVGSSAVSMIKAATAARMMGIDMNKAAATAEKLLNFESSIASELKASALLGQNVNFNYARQLAFNKDIIGANKEILKITKQVNFNQLNPIQQKAYADAAGKSVSELQDMLTQEKNIQLVRNGTNENAKKALANYERMMQLKDEEAKNEGKVAEQEILRKANQERMNQLQNKFNQMMSQLAEPIMDILSPLFDLGVFILDLLGPVFKLTGLLFKVLSPISLISKTFKIMDRLTDGLFGKITKAFSPLYWILDIVKLLIVGFQSFADFLDDIEDGNMSIGDAFNKMTDSMVTGFKEVGTQILKELTEPFMIAKEKISEWLGFSPSEIGLSMVKGLKSVGGMLLDAIITPFIMGYNKIAKYVPGLSEMKMPNELATDLINDTKKTGDNSKSLNNDTLNNAIQSGNQQMVAKIDQLISMMANGGIAVNLDGQRINAALSTTMLKSGGFGQATTRA